MMFLFQYSLKTFKTILLSYSIKLMIYFSESNYFRTNEFKFSSFFLTNIQMNLFYAGVNGEHTVSTDGIYDVSNKRRLGLTEYEAVKEMCFGVRKIIETEKSLK